MPTTKVVKYRIVGGPNEMDLMTSLFGRDREDRVARFTMKAISGVGSILKTIYPTLLITALEHGDDDHSWIFKAESPSSGTLWTGTYSHKTRRGLAEFIREN